MMAHGLSICLTRSMYLRTEAFIGQCGKGFAVVGHPRFVQQFFRRQFVSKFRRRAVARLLRAGINRCRRSPGTRIGRGRT